MEFMGRVVKAGWAGVGVMERDDNDIYYCRNPSGSIAV